MRTPSLVALRAFEVAARSRNFTEAAHELSVTPGAVSRQIRLLEEELGVSLFDRTRNTVTLNDNGRRLAATVSQAFALLAEGRRRCGACPRGRCRSAVRPPSRPTG